ncbi:MAG: helix-turn-helix transcriptional regulator [Clostridia bacterium]|nr:helix-turn-helix transcriptional regulator [Clostridia bacterium]
MKDLLSSEYIIGHIGCVIKSFMPEGMYENVVKGRHSECLVFVTSGNAQYSFGASILNVEKGDVLFLAKNSRYTIRVFPDYKFIYTDFDICSEDSGKLVSAVYKPDPRKTNEAFRSLLFYWTRGGRKRYTKSRELLYSIYDLLFDSKIGDTESHLALIEPAIRMIAEHSANEPISVENLADACGISCVHLRRMFMKQFGMPPVKYISKQKIDRAKELLRYDTSSITAIAEMLGYSGIFYFCKSFKKETGLTPGEYRKLHGK